MRLRHLTSSREQTGRPERPERPERRRGERRERVRRLERRRSTDAAREQATAERPVAELRALPPVAGGACDPAAEKVRRAGGPCDQAVYTCACGYVFSAPVSTTVSCPNCGTGQAW